MPGLLPSEHLITSAPAQALQGEEVAPEAFGGKWAARKVDRGVKVV